MASLNITSLLKRVDELRILLDGQYSDIRAINETRLDGSISDQDVKIVGCDVIRRDRTVLRSSGVYTSIFVQIMQRAPGSLID